MIRVRERERGKRRGKGREERGEMSVDGETDSVDLVEAGLGS